MIESSTENVQEKFSLRELRPSYRLLLGPGPCNVDPRLLQIIAAPQLSHLDPEFLVILEEISRFLRLAFQTDNEVTLCATGSGFSGAETILCNLLERGDTLIVGSMGFFSGRIAEIAERAGAQIIMLSTEPGYPLDPAKLEQAFQEHPEARFFATAIAETSTGLLQPLDELERIVHSHDALFIVDAVCGLGSVPLNITEMKIDACYGGSQKGLGAFPGFSPITLNERAMQIVRQRTQPIQTYYLNLLMLHQYWAGEHMYHHTPCSNLAYALREALGIVLEEGLEKRWARHALHGEALRMGLQALGFPMVPQPGYELSVVTVVRLLEGLDEGTLRRTLVQEYNLEIGGGLGALKGKVLRIGLMGYNARRENVELVLTALERLLPRWGLTIESGAALAAADKVYRAHE